MANHASSIKRLRQNKKRRFQNRYNYKSTRTALKKFREELNKIQKIDDKEIFKKNYRILSSKIDKLAKKNIIHKNKASHIKSSLSILIASI